MSHVDLPDVLVHVAETLGYEGLKELEGVIRTEPGVISVAFHEEKPHLIVVQFDPQLTQATRILQRVTDHGVHAELVGM
jgi:hypothetical protein